MTGDRAQSHRAKDAGDTDAKLWGQEQNVK